MSQIEKALDFNLFPLMSQTQHEMWPDTSLGLFAGLETSHIAKSITESVIILNASKSHTVTVFCVRNEHRKEWHTMTRHRCTIRKVFSFLVLWKTLRHYSDEREFPWFVFLNHNKEELSCQLLNYTVAKLKFLLKRAQTVTWIICHAHLWVLHFHIGTLCVSWHLCWCNMPVKTKQDRHV